MSEVFISYAKSDRPKAKALAAILVRHGWSVWWEREVSSVKFETRTERAGGAVKDSAGLLFKEGVVGYAQTGPLNFSSRQSNFASPFEEPRVNPRQGLKVLTPCEAGGIVLTLISRVPPTTVFSLVSEMTIRFLAHKVAR